jgi:hypothetical protein
MLYIQTLITDYYFREITLDENDNYCIICGVSMGSCNPRQFCQKTYCENEPVFDYDTEDTTDSESI